MFIESEELDAAVAEVVALCMDLTEFDLAEYNAGRITLAAARFEAAFARLQAIGGVDERSPDADNE